MAGRPEVSSSTMQKQRENLRMRDKVKKKKRAGSNIS